MIRPKPKGLFITASNTGRGKTIFSAALQLWLQRQGTDVLPMKPVETGAAEGLTDLEYTLRLTGKSPEPETLRSTRPYQFRDPCSPHLAAEREDVAYPQIRTVLGAARQLEQRCDLVVAEGAGGLLVPINRPNRLYLTDLIQALGYPVIFVCQSALGAINDACLGLETLRRRGIPILGFVLNDLEPTDPETEYIRSDNARTISEFSGVRFLGRFRHLDSADPDRLAAEIESMGELRNALREELQPDPEAPEPPALRETDLKHIWHPYTDIDQLAQLDFPIIDRAEGCYIYDDRGNAYLDGIASWWCVNFGHSHPALIRAIREQTDRLQNVILAGMSHPSVIRLSQKLAEITPEGLQYCYFTSDGASAVEAALRIAVQYWENIGETGRKKFISLQDGYHGDTLGAVNVGYIDRFHWELKPLLNQNYRALSPHCAQCPFGLHPDRCRTECFSDMESLIQKHHSETAAVIVEPLCQGAGGIRIYPEAYLQKLRRLCDEYNILLICDEIAVGFGRTGNLFASERAGIVPDLLCVGKGLTGGYLPMSAALATEKIYRSFRGGKTFYHGHTYSGNPIVSALALRALELYEEERIIDRMQELIPYLAARIKDIAAYFPHSFSYSKGLIGMIELSPEDGGAPRAARIAQQARQGGLLLRPLGPVLYVWPPLIISKKELEDLFRILEDSVRKTLK